MIVVRVPASTANLGPGFDALGMALTLYAQVEVPSAGESAGTESAGSESAGTVSGEDVDRRGLVDDAHPADVAFRAGGGVGPVRVRSPIPVGRGLGFSGAMRVGGLLAAAAQANAAAGHDVADRLAVFDAASQLEGHADNVGASLLGGVVATAGGRAVPVPLAITPAVVVWVPDTRTSTQRSRNSLPATVTYQDAAFNVGRTALLVAALATGDVDSLRTATEDRLHQDVRFSATVPSRQALAVGLDAGAWGGWLSGSGPSVALLCDPAEADLLAATVRDAVADGHTKILQIAHTGATIELR